MREFEENFEPIEIKLTNLKKETFELISKPQDSGATKEAEILMKNEKLTNTEKIHKMLVMYFGKDEKFYSQFSLDLLAKVAEYIREAQKKK